MADESPDEKKAEAADEAKDESSGNSSEASDGKDEKPKEDSATVEEKKDDKKEAKKSDDDSDDEISLDNLDDMFDGDDEGSAEEPAEESATEPEEEVVEEAPPAPWVPFKERSTVGKVIFPFHWTFATLLFVFNEILYFFGGIEAGIKKWGVQILWQWPMDLYQKVVAQIPAWKEKIIARIPKMPDLSFIKKIDLKKARMLAIYIVGAALALTAVGYVYLEFQSALKQDPFLESLESVADQVIPVNVEKMEGFYNNPRFAAFAMRLPPIVLNLSTRRKRKTPIASFEFSVEFSSQAGQDEFDQKKSLMIDLMRQSVSTWTYEELVTSKGKQKMRQQLLNEVNMSMKDGRVKHIFIESVLLKPD